MADERLGKYEIRGQLGRGAMGTVYDGWDPAIARRVAIKTVRLPDPSDADAQEELARFKREAQAAGRLNHPNIVGVFDYGETGEVAFIVMEFVDGRTLKAMLDNNERMALPEVARVMNDILAGLQFSHDRGVVHRDIKPANIIITQTGQAKIADFGIARIESSSMTQAGTVLGTPAYMSPEQFMGQVVDLRSDIYSCGVLLYQLLTGERPFEGSMTAIMHKALNTTAPKPSDLSVTCPPAFDFVVARAMAKRPEERFPDADALAEAIGTALATAARGSPSPSIDDPFDAADATMAVRPATPPGPDERPPPGPVAAGSANDAGRRGGSGKVIAVAAVVLLATLGGGAYAIFGGRAGTDVADSRLATQTSAPPSATAQPPPSVPPPNPPPATIAGPASTPAPVAASTPPATPTPAVTPTPRPVSTPTLTPSPSQPPSPPPSTRPPPERLAGIAPVTPPTPAPAIVPLPVPTPNPPAAAIPAPTPTPVPSLAPVLPPTPTPFAAISPTPTPPSVAPTQLSPAALRQAVGAITGSAQCALVAADVNEAGTAVTVTGLAGDPAMAALRSAVDVAAAGTNVVWQVSGFDGSYCPGIEAIRAVAGRGNGLLAAPNATKLHDNDLLIIQTVLPDFPAHLLIDYFDSDGNVTHLVPTTRDVPDHAIANKLYPARSRQRFGDPVPPNYPGQRIGKPQGTDMVIVIASQVPLLAFDKQVEDSRDAYFAELRSAIDAARRRGRVAATAFLLDIAIP